MRARGIATGLVALLVATAPGVARAGIADVRSALDRLVAAEGGPPGASALVQRGERIDFVRAGVADLRNNRAFHRSDRMRIASVAKAFSGAVALSLVDRGAIGLDDTLGELLPASPAQWSQVTLAQLLRHTSGVPAYNEDPQFQADFSADLRRYFSPEALVGYVADEPLAFAPGSRYGYSNTDNILVGLIAEQATGRAYASELRRLVYRPLGLERTSLPSDWLIPRRFIHGYDEPAAGEPYEDLSEVLSASGAWASGGIVSTPAELNEFIRGYGGGALFAPGVRRRQLEFVPGCGQPPGPGECATGLAIYRYRIHCGTVLGHTGNFPGYTQFAATTRNGRRSVVVSVNQAHNGDPRTPLFGLIDAANEAAACALFPPNR